MSWTDDVEEASESVKEEEDEEQPERPGPDTPFAERFRYEVKHGDLGNITVMVIESSISNVEDPALLETALEQDDRTTSTKSYERQLDQLAGESESEDAEADSNESSSEVESTDTTGSAEPPESEIAELSANEDADTEEESNSGSSWADEVKEAGNDEVETEVTEVEPPEDATTVEESDDEESELEMTSLEEEEDEESAGTTMTDAFEEDTEEEPASSAELEERVDASSIMPDAMSAEEASTTEHIWRVEVWGQPGSGKTHFCYTMPEPIILIDTEGKADDIAHKFAEDKDFYIFQPTDYDEAKEALHQGLDYLTEVKQETGKVGTIAVDSMSIIWDWSQQKYVDASNPTKDLDASEVGFSSGIGSSDESDWQYIKRYHNEEFREIMVESPFHICWTAMSQEDYQKIIEGDADGTPHKPAGEKNNVYKVNYLVHIDEADDGAPMAHLEKSGLTKHNYMGLRYPNFEKHREVVRSIEEAETTNEDVAPADITDEDVDIIEGRPPR